MLLLTNLFRSRACQNLRCPKVSCPSPVPGPRRRLKYGSLPVPVASCEVAYAKRRPELKGLTPAEATRLILDSPVFAASVMPKLLALDAARGGYGRMPLYRSLELESVFVYQRARGLRSVKEARANLGGDRQAQQLLGFDEVRARVASATRCRQSRRCLVIVAASAKRLGFQPTATSSANSGTSF